MTRTTQDLQAADAAHFLHPFTDHQGLARKGARIIPGKFRDASTRTDLLVYEPASGDAHFYTTDGLGGTGSLGIQHSGWRRTWQIFPLGPSGSSKTDLLFFDSFATAP